MEYPGTLRPGRTRENISFQDLPIGDEDPDPVPWPHFQDLEFYHVWGAPHPHPKRVNEMIYEEGRWATAEEEAEMMRDARRGVRRMKEMQEAEKKAFVVVDDDEEEEVMVVEEDMLMKGVQEMFSVQTDKKASPAPERARAAPVDVEGDDNIDFSELSFDEDEEDESDDLVEEDFLLDLGYACFYSFVAKISFTECHSVKFSHFFSLVCSIFHCYTTQSR